MFEKLKAKRRIQKALNQFEKDKLTEEMQRERLLSSKTGEKDNAKNKLITDIENSLYSPFGGFSSFELEYDPFMTMRRIIGEQVDNFKIDNEGLLYIEYNKQNYYLIRAIINSEFDNSNRELLARDSAELKDQFATEGVNLLYTGEVFFADAATKASVDDMTRIGVISTIDRKSTRLNS